MTLDTSHSTLRFDNIQSVKHVGLHLRNEVFTHGQLYGTLSWCISNLKIKISINNHFWVYYIFTGLSILLSHIALILCTEVNQETATYNCPCVNTAFLRSNPT